nr:unnamed protein product [Digitaria exilis]
MWLQIDNFDPCTDYYVEAYLNHPDVQRALHANVTRLGHPCRYSVNQLQLPVAAKWRPWFSDTKYKGKEKGSLSLVTVRGAGHEVPSYQPKRALVLVQSFLAGKTLPDCKKCESF